MDKNQRKEKIARALLEAREKKGLKKSEVARLASMPYTTYASYEAGHRLPDLDVIRKIATAMGVYWQTLYGLEYKGTDTKGNQIWGEEDEPDDGTLQKMFEIDKQYKEVADQINKNVSILNLEARKQVKVFTDFLVQDTKNHKKKIPEDQIYVSAYFVNAEKKHSPDPEESEE